MRRAELAQFIFLQVLGVVIAATVFKVIDSRLFAGMVAGFYFVNSGAYMLWRIVQWPDRFRSFTLYPLLIHLFGISIPLMVARLMNVHLAYEEIKIWGIPGPAFHQISTIVYSILVFATIADLTRARRASAK